MKVDSRVSHVKVKRSTEWRDSRDRGPDRDAPPIKINKGSRFSFLARHSGQDHTARHRSPVHLPHTPAARRGGEVTGPRVQTGSGRGESAWTRALGGEPRAAEPGAERRVCRCARARCRASARGPMAAMRDARVPCGPELGIKSERSDTLNGSFTPIPLTTQYNPGWNNMKPARAQ